MRVGMLTREFPPHVYGGGGVHVEFLVGALRRRDVQVAVHCIGEARPGATAHRDDDARLRAANPTLPILSADLSMAAAVAGVDLVHSHTWYANLAGFLAGRLHDVPHVVTAHSLEPRRPWKAEQLGGGYRVSGWAERTAFESADAVVAVSAAMRADVLACYPQVDPDRVHVIHNGVDTNFYRPVPDTDLVESLGVDPARPYVAFVGRVARQKGIDHLLRAAAELDRDIQVVLLAGAADTPELAAEIDRSADELRRGRAGVVLVHGMQPGELVREVLTHAAVFCCPSIYEPMGIVNLEAMASGTPVVAGAVGGIPEVVVDGGTGVLVPYDERDPVGYRKGLAAAINEVVADPARARAMGRAGRDRARSTFSWDVVAERTAALYRRTRAG
nr:glycogen synthase [Pseudonocardia sp. TRM90224]